MCRLEDDFKSCGSLILAVFIFILVSIAWFSSDMRDGFVLQDSFMFNGNKLCIHRISLQDILVWELHAGGADRHFGRDKTIAPVEDQFHWPNLKRDVAKIIGQCQTCQLAKHGGYILHCRCHMLRDRTLVWISCLDF